MVVWLKSWPVERDFHLILFLKRRTDPDHVKDPEASDPSWLI